jgi:hypothetical protein
MGSALVDRLVTRSLKSLRNPRNTYKLNSAMEIGLPAAASSSNYKKCKLNEEKKMRAERLRIIATQPCDFF